MARIHRGDDGKLPAYAWPGGYPIMYVTADNSVLCPACAYCNAGDTYATTLVYDRDHDRVIISSWGDIAERDPRLQEGG